MLLRYLNSSFGEVDAHGDFFSCVNVRVMGLLEGPFQFLQSINTKLQVVTLPAISRTI